MTEATPKVETCKRPRFRWLRRTILVLAILLLGAVLLQRKFLYYNWGWSPAFPPMGEVEAVDVSIPTADRQTLSALWAKAPEGAPCPLPERPTVLFCHGNSGDLVRWRGHAARWRQALGADVLLFDYRGYGKSTGTPSEPGLYEDVEAAYRWLLREQRVDPHRLIIVGQSLGGGPACYLASKVDHRMLILESTFTRIPDLVTDLFLGVPLGWTMFDEFPNERRLQGYARPLFVSHGQSDRLIGFRHAERLLAAAAGPKELLPLPGLGHHDKRKDDYIAAVRKFVVEHWKPRSEKRM